MGFKNLLGNIKILNLVTGRNEVVAKVMFLQVSVCPRGGGGRVSASVHAGMPDPPLHQAHPPPDQAPPQDQADPPRTRQTPPPEADSSIRSTSGRYAFYWNAFLFSLPLLIYTDSSFVGTYSCLSSSILGLQA